MTWHALKKLRQKKFPSEEAKAEAISKARTQLARKRRIKDRVSDERSRPALHPAATPVWTIPIEVLDEGPYVHHAITPDDIRAVLGALPNAAKEGISRLRLSLSKQDMEKNSAGRKFKRDPFTGRLSVEIFPGVYGGRIAGTFSRSDGCLKVHAYVYDDACLPLPRTLCEFYLRLHALMTLMHEVAHHHDKAERVRRGRWLADRKENVEWYAEKMEHQWTREVVIPYLQRTYSDQCRSFQKWVSHRGGVMLPIEFFSGDSRRTGRDGLVRIDLNTSDAFECWVEGLHRKTSLAASRLAFAWELHDVDQYEYCLTILGGILEADPSSIPALTCKADTLVHLERCDEAQVVAEAVLRSAPSCAEVWEVLGDVLESREDWLGLLANCAKWEAAGKVRRPAQRDLLMHRAIAHCALDHLAEMEACLQVRHVLFRYNSEEAAARRGAFTRRNVFRRAGKPVPEADAS